MQAVYRYGDEASARRYPLPVSADPVWRTADGHVTATIPVPRCPRRHILVPSLALYRQTARFQCALAVADSIWPLQTVDAAPARNKTTEQANADAPPLAPNAGGSEVSTHIDCFHTERDLPESRLILRLARPAPPERFLLTLSIRPLEIEPEVPAPTRVVLSRPPAISQMQGPENIRGRICSPTALAMALQAAQPVVAWRSVVDACFDGRFYGSWPLAIQCAGAHGRIGAVEAVASWDPVLCVLRAGSPVVASIRFGRGELPGAPLAHTGGHLVSLYGIDGDRVLVNDPAAPDEASVPLVYDLRKFTRAWLRRRGAAYFLAPP